MRFQFSGKTYVIEFAREVKVPTFSAAGLGRVYTTGRVLQEEVVSGVKVYTVIREYTVGCGPSDRFSYEGGRKASLVMALKDAPTMKGGKPLMGSPLSKKFKTAVWNAYHGRSAKYANWVRK